jgi:hypothetical protein
MRALSADIQNPTNLSVLRAKRFIKYLLGTLTLSWLFQYQTEKEGTEYKVYGDSDWAGDVVARKSVSAGILFRGRHPIESWSVGQQVVSLSSGESEFYAAGLAAGHLLFILHLVRELSWTAVGRLYSDSSAARGTMARVGPGNKLRHVQTRFLWLQEQVRERAFTVCTVPGDSNPGDLGTKVLQVDKLWQLLACCGMALSTKVAVANRPVGLKKAAQIQVLTIMTLLSRVRGETRLVVDMAGFMHEVNVFGPMILAILLGASEPTTSGRRWSGGT